MDEKQAQIVAKRDQAWALLQDRKAVIEKIYEQGLNHNSPFEIDTLQRVLATVVGDLHGRELGNIT